MRPILTAALLFALAASLVPAWPAGADSASNAPVVLPAAETVAVADTGDAADDACIWVAPDPARSVVIGTNKQRGLDVFDLEGNRLHSVEVGDLNNVDLRTGFPLGGDSVALVAASNRTTNTIEVFALDPETRALRNVAARPLEAGMEVYGFCLYRSAVSGKYYAFINAKSGKVEQWELRDNGQGQVDGEVVRTFWVGSQVEGCVADDALGLLYIGEENVAIWRYGAEPDAEPEQRRVVETTAPLGRFRPDLEGVTLYIQPGGDGYLIASSQENNEFLVYDRQPPNHYIGRFTIGGTDKIDAVTHTDGICVTSRPLGEAFPAGLFVAQDDENDDGNQNFKLVSWARIQAVLDGTADDD